MPSSIMPWPRGDEREEGRLDGEGTGDALSHLVEPRTAVSVDFLGHARGIRRPERAEAIHFFRGPVGHGPSKKRLASMSPPRKTPAAMSRPRTDQPRNRKSQTEQMA